MQGAESNGSHPLCPKCGTPKPVRIRRQGLMQRFILPYLGLFPWKCGNCGNAFTARERGKTRRRRRPAESEA